MERVQAWLIMLATDINFRWVLMGSIVLGLTGGVVGTFAVLKKVSLIGDVMSHAALPGIVLAFLWTFQKSTPILLAGAFSTAFLAAWISMFLPSQRRIKQDAALAVVLTTFYGMGIILLTILAKSGSGQQGGLSAYLFGQAASLVKRDVQTIALLSMLLIIMIVLFYKPLKVYSFDPVFAKTNGLPLSAMNFLLTLLLTLAIVIGLQTVGVILMSALLIIPPLTARYLTHRLFPMIVLSAFFGALAGITGASLSTLLPRLPTGPLIVLSATIFFLLAMLFGPERGIMRRLRDAKQLQKTLGANLSEQTHRSSVPDPSVAFPYNAHNNAQVTALSTEYFKTVRKKD